MAEIKRTYYRIREVSEMLGVPYSTLRFWEQNVQQLRPRTNAGHTRFYSEHDIALLKRIQYMRDVQNVPISDLSSRLKLEDMDIDPRIQATELLTTIRAELVALRDLL